MLLPLLWPEGVQGENRAEDVDEGAPDGKLRGAVESKVRVRVGMG